MKNNNALEKLNGCDSYLYIGDRSTMLFHSKNCPTLLLLQSYENLQGCGKKPEGSGFFPCHRCLPRLAEEADARRAILLGLDRTKASVIRDEMRILCNEYGMYIEFVGNIAFVTTIAGEWFFDPNIRPIKLHHKNIEMRYDQSGCLTGYYHLQEPTFETPAHVLGYIYGHEQATIKRLSKIREDYF